jgi:hypothetical protein
VIANAERIVSDFLRERLSVRVVGQPPGNTTTSWVRVTQLSAVADGDDPTGHLVDHYLQLDCYAGREGGQPEAMTLGMQVRDALWEITEADPDDAVVTAGRADGPFHNPDDSFEPARERGIVTAHAWMHT